jgi:hypothetical protein
MATLIDTEFFARLNALNDKFAASVPATLARLRASATPSSPAPDAALIKELHQILHTIAGSAATFGFRILGQQAREPRTAAAGADGLRPYCRADWDQLAGPWTIYRLGRPIDPKADNYIDE